MKDDTPFGLEENTSKHDIVADKNEDLKEENLQLDEAFDEESKDAVEEVSYDHLPYPELARRYKSGEPLSDEDIDFIANIAVDTLRTVLKFFDAEDSQIDEYEGGKGELIFDVMNPDLAVLIGRHGKTLEAIQLMVSTIVNKKIGFRFPVVVDIESYKNRRQRKLEDIAFNAADKALRQRRAVKLHPMSSYDRRIIHLTLRSNKRIVTYSEGDDPERCVVIQPK